MAGSCCRPSLERTVQSSFVIAVTEQEHGIKWNLQPTHSQGKERDYRVDVKDARVKCTEGNRFKVDDITYTRSTVSIKCDQSLSKYGWVMVLEVLYDSDAIIWRRKEIFSIELATEPKAVRGEVSQ